jgi:Family of unknown function (DUF5362)
MEEQNESQNSPLFDLSIDQTVRSHLSETARWGKFLAIVGLIFCALFVVLGIFMATSFNSIQSSSGYYRETSPMAGFGVLAAVVYIIVALLYFFPCLFLLRFSNKMKTALAANSQEDLTASFQNLKVLYRYVGILTIICLGLWLLMILFGGLGFMMMGGR